MFSWEIEKGKYYSTIPLGAVKVLRVITIKKIRVVTASGKQKYILSPKLFKNKITKAAFKSVEIHLNEKQSNAEKEARRYKRMLQRTFHQKEEKALVKSKAIKRKKELQVLQIRGKRKKG